MGLVVIDEDGYRPNVGIILINKENHVLWARRIGQNAWQFPQGGIMKGETAEQALYRELKEEIGLSSESVKILARTDGWLKYDLPQNLIRQHQFPLCIGQKQVWFLLRMLTDDSEIKIDTTDSPEFDDWRWVDYWYPLKEVVSFKKNVYNQALDFFANNVLDKYMQ